jgi:hypothetical protein
MSYWLEFGRRRTTRRVDCLSLTQEESGPAAIYIGQSMEDLMLSRNRAPARGGSECFRSLAQSQQAVAPSQQAVAPRTISPGRADFSPGPADLVCDVVQVAPLAQLACHPLALPGHLAQRHEDRQDHAARHKVQVLRWDH